MIRIRLDDQRRAELQALRRTDLPPTARTRLEMVLLSDAGWSPPRIAAHLACHPHTCRAALRRFEHRGHDGLRPGTPGPAPDAGRRAVIEALLRERLGEERTWTSAQLAEALRAGGTVLSPRQVRRYLGGMDAGYRRTAQTVSHKQDAAKVGRATVTLDGLQKKRPPAGCGCSTSTRVGSPRRCRPGTRGACRASASGSSTSTRRGGG